MNASDEKTFSGSPADDRASQAYQQLIGCVGLVLPIFLWLLAGLRSTPEIVTPTWTPLGSVSAYYYTGGVAFFSGALFALALFLYTYNGYKNEWGYLDRIAARIAGTAALFVAFFPTGAPPDVSRLSWWTDSTGVIHYIAAAVLFSSFAFFSLFLFTRTNPDKTKPRGKHKTLRNGIFYVCGIGILMFLIWIVIAARNNQPIFWQEVGALELFALSWLVKGHVEQTPGKAVAKTREIASSAQQSFKATLRKLSPPKDS